MATLRVLLALAMLGSLVISAASDWGYDDASGHGPKDWPGVCSFGARQSPIDLKSAHATIDCSLEPIELIGYNKPLDGFSVKNNGHAVQISLTKEDTSKYTLRGGGLEHEYNLLQLHFHWAQANGTTPRGSEHTVTQLSYPVEVHFVHVRADLADKPLAEGALAHGDGLAVIGVMVHVDDAASADAFDAIGAQLGSIRRADEESSSSEELVLRTLMPRDMSNFYRYDGSLTTPPCSEAVVWTVMAEPVAISVEHISALRELRDTHNEPIYNFRPPQALNGRKVRQVRAQGYCNVKASRYAGYHTAAASSPSTSWIVALGLATTAAVAART